MKVERIGEQQFVVRCHGCDMRCLGSAITPSRAILEAIDWFFFRNIGDHLLCSACVEKLAKTQSFEPV